MLNNGDSMLANSLSSILSEIACAVAASILPSVEGLTGAPAPIMSVRNNKKNEDKFPSFLVAASMGYIKNTEQEPL